MNKIDVVADSLILRLNFDTIKEFTPPFPLVRLFFNISLVDRSVGQTIIEAKIRPFILHLVGLQLPLIVDIGKRLTTGELSDETIFALEFRKIFYDFLRMQ